MDRLLTLLNDRVDTILSIVTSVLILVGFFIIDPFNWWQNIKEKKRDAELRQKAEAAKLLKKEVNIHRIASVNDGDYYAALTFHANNFHSNLGGRRNDLGRWVREQEEAISRGDELEWDEYLLCAKKDDEIIGYLFGSYHLPTSYMFISYFATDQSKFSRKTKTARQLLMSLQEELRLSYPNGVNVRAILAELDLTEGADGRPMGFKLRDDFGYHARGMGVMAYVIEGFTYRQPVVDIDVLRRRLITEKEIPLEGEQLLLYVEMNRQVSRDHLSKEEMLSILDFLLFEVYADSYDTNESAWEEYKDYAARVYNAWKPRIQDRVTIAPAYVGESSRS